MADGAVAELALSAVMLAIEVLTDKPSKSIDDPPNDVLFGLAFFNAAYGITRPALDVTTLQWASNHFVRCKTRSFELAIALFARKAEN